jgi:hypothetical protein
LGPLAVIVADPADMAVTGTDTLAAPAANVTAGGTAAMLVLLEAKLTVKAVDAGADRFSVRFCVPVPLIARLVCEKLIVSGGGTDPPVTCT